MEWITNYFRDAVAEIRKVTWPSKREVTQYTITVIAMSLGLALFLGGLDAVFNQILSKII